MIRLIYFALLTFLFIPELAIAQKGRGATQTTKIGFIQQTYSGSNNLSFAEGGPSYGGEFSTDRGSTFIRYFLKGRAGVSEGRQGFLNGATVFQSNYKLTSFAPELGISIYPVLRRERGVNIYLWGVGIVSYNLLEITTPPANSNIRTKDQGMGYGYGGGIGFEFLIGSGRAAAKMMIYGEVGFRDEKAQLVQSNNFEIGGMTASLGIGF